MTKLSPDRLRTASKPDGRMGSAPADLSSLFVSESAIPRKFRLDRPVEQRRVIIDGGPTLWKGRTVDIFLRSKSEHRPGWPLNAWAPVRT